MLPSGRSGAPFSPAAAPFSPAAAHRAAVGASLHGVLGSLNEPHAADGLTGISAAGLLQLSSVVAYRADHVLPALKPSASGTSRQPLKRQRSGPGADALQQPVQQEPGNGGGASQQPAQQHAGGYDDVRDGENFLDREREDAVVAQLEAAWPEVAGAPSASAASAAACAAARAAHRRTLRPGSWRARAADAAAARGGLPLRVLASLPVASERPEA
eukprot:301981-Chlamydomonas_euryale.AAC.1